MKLFQVVAIVGGAGLVAFAIWNPIGLCKRHEFLYEQEGLSQKEREVSVFTRQYGWREEGRTIFAKNSYWGSPYQVVVSTAFQAKNHRVTSVSIHDDETDERIALPEDKQQSRGGKWSNWNAAYLSSPLSLPYHDFTVLFDIETIDKTGRVVERASFRISVKKSLKTYWGSDLLDGMMSV